MKEKAPRVVICLTTHDRVDCARINLEILKLNYRQPFPVVHAFSTGEQACFPYLEDMAVPCATLPLAEGAVNLLQRSIEAAMQRFNPEFIVHLEADTWLLDESVLHRLIDALGRSDHKVLATCRWNDDRLDRYGPRTRLGRIMQAGLANRLRRFGIDYRLDNLESLATQFFVMKTDTAMVESVMAVRAQPKRSVEEVFWDSFMQRHGARNLLVIREREPVHPLNRYWCAALSLYCQHWPARGTALDPRKPTHPLYVSPDMDGKREALLLHPHIRNGEHLQRLIGTTDFSYYNPGAKRY